MSRPQSQRGIREPLQSRSKDSWERILQAGLDILLEEGRSAVTIQAISQRAGVAPTALYARVDGIQSLVWALYDRGFIPLIESVARDFEEAERTTAAGTRERVSAVVAAITRMFDAHVAFLHPIITQAAVDPVLRDRGMEDCRPLVRTMTELLTSGDEAAADQVARMLMAEGTYRAFFGNDFLTAVPEPLEEFSARLEAMSWARLEPSRGTGSRKTSS